MNDTVKSLQKAIAIHKAREFGYQDTINALACKIEQLVASQTRLLMRTDRLLRENTENKRDIKHLQQAVLDMAAKQPRIEREVAKFEKLNNNNTFGG